MLQRSSVPCAAFDLFITQCQKMLTLILGPSGAGKTAVIDELVCRHGWVPITSYISRPRRIDDKFKESIPEDEYRRLRESRQLFSDVGQLGSFYGILVTDIEAAVADTSRHVLDFAFRQRHAIFLHVPHVAIALLPESENELLRRLTLAGRPERVSQALADLHDVRIESETKQMSSALPPPLVVICERDRVPEAALQIVKLVAMNPAHEPSKIN